MSRKKVTSEKQGEGD